MSTTEQVKKHVPNPTGKGGFQDHPELRSPGGWKKENTISYQYNRYMNMGEAEFAEVSKEPNRTMAMVIAYNRVKEAKTSLPDVKEISDRTVGKPSQSIDITTGGEPIKALVEFTNEPTDNKD